MSGNPDYVLYKASNLQGNTTICSSGPLQVSIAAVDDVSGWGGYYSGFEKYFIPEVSILPNAACPDTLRVKKQNIDDALTWYLNGQPLNPAPTVDSVLALTQAGDYMVVGQYTTFCGEVVYDTAYFAVADFVTIQTDVTAANCTEGQPGGIIAVQASGGNGLLYSLDNGQFLTNNVFSGVPVGTHHVLVKNQSGCIFNQLVEVPANMPHLLRPKLCPGETVQVGASVFSSNNPSGVVYLPGSGICDSIIDVQLDFYDAAAKFINSTLCPGESLVVGDVTFDAAHASGTVLLEGGSFTGCDSTVSVSLTYFAPIPVTIHQSVVCDTSLAGENTEMFSSATGCDSLVTTIATYSPTAFPILDITEQAAPCPGLPGSLQVEVLTNGTAPFEFAIAGGPTQLNNGVFEDLQPGFYAVTVTDAGLCSTIVEGIVDPAPELTVDLGEDLTINRGDTIHLQPAITPSALLEGFSWADVRWLSCGDCLFPLAVPLLDINYTLEVTYNDGCKASATKQIKVNPSYRFFIPNVIDPGSDLNNRITVFGDEFLIKVQFFQVYDRWGEMIFSNTDFDPNLLEAGWNGTFRGQPVVPGVYQLLAKVEYLDGFTEILTQDVTVLR